MSSLTAQGIAAYRRGNNDEARVLLTQAVLANPNDAYAWLCLLAALDTDIERLRYLHYAVRLQQADPSLYPAIMQRFASEVLAHESRPAIALAPSRGSDLRRLVAAVALVALAMLFALITSPTWTPELHVMLSPERDVTATVPGVIAQIHATASPPATQQTAVIKIIPTLTPAYSPTPEPSSTPTATPEPEPTVIPAPTGNIERGAQLYTAKGCVYCHGTEAQGVEGQIPRIAGTRLSFVQVLAQIRHSPSGLMPSFPPDFISDNDARDIYAFLKSLGQ